MTKGLFLCAIACSVAAPAFAGERTTTVAAAWVLPPLILPVSEKPVFGAALVARSDILITLRAQPWVMLADFEDHVPKLDLVSDVAAAPVVLVSPYATTNVRSLAAWRLTGRITPMTANASGFYAVRDTLGEYRKPRVFRPSALSATLVLRIDGKEDTPSLGVGGGGVAAALWKAGRQQ